jgi:hypothetical protein
VWRLIKDVNHRVDRVLGFSPSRPYWDPPPRHLQASVSPPLVLGGSISLAGMVVGMSHFGRGDGHCGTLGIYVFCDVNPGDDLYHLGRSHCDFRGVNEEQKNIF